ncbi:uncharacterized protein [Rutidosis leptorrhynchoides]|uniref:uncharacterized protein n=1 Tax=Rutidosis leptorrhynchoides TaxID=125765 RepID=UPI003A99B553
MVHAWHSGQRRKAEQLEEWEAEAIIFPPMKTINSSHAPIIIKGCITDCGYNVRRLNVDIGSNVDVMYEYCFKQLPEIIKSKMRALKTVLSGFSCESTWPLGCIELELELFDDNDLTRTRDVLVEFCVKFGAVTSTVHGMIKFPTKQGIATVRTESGRALCASVTLPKLRQNDEEDGYEEEIPITTGRTSVTLPKPLLTNEEHIQSSSILVNLKYPDKRIQVGGNLSDEIKDQLRDILVANMDIFVWCEDDMTGVPRNIAEHKLNANPNLTPVHQKKRPMSPERIECLSLEVDKLVHANILREVRYHTWVANPVLVKKEIAHGASASILRILIRRSLRTIILCLKLTGKLNLFPISGSNGFRMRIRGITIFRWQKRMKTKPHSTPTRLNPTKCSFGEEEDIFLGHIVTPRGIKANLKKIEAVERMNSPKSRKEVQSLTEDKKAFVEMKSLLKELPTLTTPIAGEMLMLYLVTSKEAISSVLVADRDIALSGSEVNYPPIEIVYALVHTARQPRRYLQPEISGRLAKWVILLGEHEINYSPRTAVKDGACGLEGAGTRLVLTSLKGEEHTYALQFTFVANNNESEYEALLSGMRIAQQLRTKHLDVYVNSQLVANQGQHKKADALRKLAALAFDHLHKNVWVEVLTEKSIDEKVIVVTIEDESPNWMTPLVKFIIEGELPVDEKVARKVRMKAPMYALIEGVLYRKSYLGLSLLCIGPNQAKVGL